MPDDPLLKFGLPGVKKLKSGKVREIFDLGPLLFVATDRISAFDCMMPNGIPRKGEVLTQIAYFLFAANRVLRAQPSGFEGGGGAAGRLAAVWGQLARRSMVVKKGPTAGYRCVVRGYLAGSGWKEYHEVGLGLRPQTAGRPQRSPVALTAFLPPPPRPKPAMTKISPYFS